jgi:hypothetical protein
MSTAAHWPSDVPSKKARPANPHVWGRSALKRTAQRRSRQHTSLEDVSAEGTRCFTTGETLRVCATRRRLTRRSSSCTGRTASAADARAERRREPRHRVTDQPGLRARQVRCAAPARRCGPADSRARAAAGAPASSRGAAALFLGVGRAVGVPVVAQARPAREQLLLVLVDLDRRREPILVHLGHLVESVPGAGVAALVLLLGSASATAGTASFSVASRWRPAPPR